MDVELGRGPLAERYRAELVRRVSDGDRSSVSALVGAWGSGKSWILAHMQRALPEDPEFIAANATLVSFNPWFYADEGALFSGFSSLLVQGTLEVQRSRKAVASLLQSLGPAAKFGGVDVSGPMTAVGARLMDSTPQRIRSAISNGLRRTNRKLLVIMDDLDRLSPGELLTVFKLVRLVGDVPGLHYLLAYDEVTLQHLLEQTPLAAASPERARRYLEKIVERRFVVPPLTPEQIEALLFRRLPSPVAAGDSTAGLDETIDYRLQDLLARVVTTPRAAERFVDLATSVPAPLWQELPARDLYESLFWRMFAPEAWHVIVDERRFLSGQEMIFGEDERGRRASAVLERLNSAVSGLGIKDELLVSFSEHFPSLRDATGANRNSYIQVRDRGIGDRDFVDHYLWLEVPPGSISEVEVARLLSGMPGSDASSSLAQLWTDSPRLALSAVERNIGRFPSARPHLLDWAADIYGTLPSQRVNPFQGRDRALKSFASRVVKELGTQELQVLREGTVFAGSDLAVDVLRALKRDLPADSDVLLAASEMASEATPRIVEYLRAIDGAALAEPGPADAYLRLAFLSRLDLRAVAIEMRDAKVWDGVDVLCLYVARNIGPEDEHLLIRWAEAETHLGADLVWSFVQTVDPAASSVDVDQLDLAADRRAVTISLMARRQSAQE